MADVKRKPGESPMAYLERLHDEDPDIQAEYERQKPHWAAIRALVDARRKAGLSQAALAARMGVSQAVIGRLEGGEHSPRLDTLATAARAMDLEVEVTFKKRSRVVPPHDGDRKVVPARRPAARRTSTSRTAKR